MTKKLPFSTVFILVLFLLIALPKQTFSQSNWDKLVPMAQKHYTPEQARELSEVKIKQINFLYAKSFYFERNDKLISKPCNTSTVDVEKYDRLRYQDKIRKIEISGCNDFIVLISLNDVKIALSKIEENKE
ncbi:MAG: hypothetical protein WCK02_05120 [Bacteroidota bacterium]